MEAIHLLPRNRALCSDLLGAKSALADACQGLCIEVSVESAARQGMALELMRTWSGAVLLQRTIAMQMRELP